MQGITLEISRFNPYTNDKSPTLRGFCNVTVSASDSGFSLEIRDCKYHRKPDGSDWVATPSRPYETDDGQRAYFNLVRIMDDEDYKWFQRTACALLAALDNPRPAETTAPAEVHIDEDEIPF